MFDSVGTTAAKGALVQVAAMVFLSPLWLVALAPWSALAVWLFRGRRPRVRVPFLRLWRGPVPLEIPKSGWEMPPVWVIATLVAILTAILAASRPLLRIGNRPRQPIVIFVDRGLTMSAKQEGQLRFARAAAEVNGLLSSRLPASSPVDLQFVPGGAEPASLRNWISLVQNQSPTALDTRAALEAAIRAQLQSSQAPIVVLSDLELGIEDPRLIQIWPQRPIENVAILRLAARASPAPQIMVELKNDSSRSAATVHLGSGNNQVEQRVMLPQRGTTQKYFFDLPSLDKEIEARLVEADDQPADDRAWLVREGANPKIEVRAPLTPELQRMIEVYSRRRPPGRESRAVIVVDSAAQIPADSAAVIVAPATESLLRATPNVGAHPLTDHVSWNSLPADLKIAGGGPPAGWTPLVSAGNQALVAVESDPQRRVWVGFASDAWSRTTDFVVFWADVFSWLGQGEEDYADHSLDAFQPGWKLATLPSFSPPPQAGQWPGIYQTADGRRVALNAELVDQANSKPADWQARLVAALGAPALASDVSPQLLFISLAAMVGAALTYKRPNLTPFPARRTF